jgi:hypothetical protein
MTAGTSERAVLTEAGPADEGLPAAAPRPPMTAAPHPPVTAGSRPPAARWLSGAALLVGLLQSVTGVVWWVLDLTAVPAYGDTREYLELAGSLQVDSYRTLAYPTLVRTALEVGERTGVPYQVPLYLGQTALLVLAVWYVVRTVAPSASRAKVLLATTLVATSPLPLHYAASVLSDSTASSLFVVALAGTARLAFRADRSVRTVAVTGAATVGAGLVRSEKGMVLVAFAVAVLLVLLVRRLRRGPRPHGRFRAAALVLVVAVVLPSAAATAVNRATQTADLGRPPLTLEATVFNRVVWPHLTEIRDQLPADARDRISPEDAAAFDVHNNGVMGMIQLMRDLDGGGDRITRAAIRAALACCAGTVAATAAADAGEYAVAPVTFLWEGVPLVWDGAPGVFPRETPTGWNITRMNEAHPTVTSAWLLVSWVLLVLLLAVALVSASTARRGRAGGRSGRRAGSPWTVGIVAVWLGTVLNACLFAASQGADANLRYALSTVLAVQCALVVTLVLHATATTGGAGAVTRRPVPAGG